MSLVVTLKQNVGVTVSTRTVRVSLGNRGPQGPPGPAGPGGGGGRGASVILWVPSGSLTPAPGEEVFMVWYWPDAPPVSGLAPGWFPLLSWTLPPVWVVDPDDYVLVLLGEDQWPSVYAQVTPTGFVSVPLNGGDFVLASCDTYGNPTGWVGQNNTNPLTGGTLVTDPATEFVPLSMASERVSLSYGYDGNLSGMSNAAEAFGFLDNLSPSGATVDVGTTTTGAPGSPASVVNVGTTTDAIFDFTIPEGLQGDKGDPGDPGSPGAAATVDAGTTTTVPFGDPATVTNSGTTSAAIFDFEIPQGEQGVPGDPGAPGAAATIAAGTATSVPYGDPPTVTNIGSSSAAVFDFEIPEGPQGPPGTPGAGGALGYYGSFYDTQTQIAAPGSVYAIEMNTTLESNGVTVGLDGLGNPTVLTFANAGTYSVTYSVQLANTDTSKSHEAAVWLELNGLMLPDTASTFTVESKHSGINGYLIGTVNYVQTFAAGDEIRFLWSVSDAAVRLDYPAPVTFGAPYAPSVIVTVAQVMFTQLGPTGPAGPGVPVGGVAGDYLRKSSGTNYDTAWTAPSWTAAQTTSGVFESARAALPIGVSATQISGTTGGHALIPAASSASSFTLSLGTMALGQTIRSGTVNVLGVWVTATSLTAGQQLILVAYNPSATTGLPTTLAWSQVLTAGTSTLYVAATGLNLSVPAGGWVGVLNPSTNAGSVTLVGAQPTGGGLFLGALTRFGLAAGAQGTTPNADVSAYTYATAAGATTFAVQQAVPQVIGRLT